MEDYSKSAKNVVMNVASLYNPASDKFIGVLQFLTAEILVSKVVRNFLKKPKSFTELGFIHALSLPYLGGLDFLNKDQPTLDSSWYNQFMASSAQIPAVFLAEYIYSVFGGSGLLHKPKFDLYDVMITMGSKTITRPIFSALASQKFFPSNLRDSYEVLSAVIDNQRKVSNVTSFKGA